MTELRVGTVQFAPTANAADNRDYLARVMAPLPELDLIVLPEYAAWFDRDTSRWKDGAEPIDGPFVGLLTETARAHGATVIAGMLVREGDRVSNGVVVVDATGLIGRYDKVHLYDAFGARESDVIAAGSPDAIPVVVDVAGVRVGVQTCYDIRFPEVSRRLIDAGAEVLVVPADWVPGPLKVEHWETLLRARAIENLAWVVAVDHAAPSGIGHSMVISPTADLVDNSGDAAVVSFRTIDVSAVADARRVNPALTARRYGIVPLDGSGSTSR